LSSLPPPDASLPDAAPRHDLHYQVWPRRLPRSITPPATSLWHNLAVSALRFPDKPALVFFDRVLSYAEVLRQAERLAATLHRLGVRKGDRVVLNMQNCPQWVIAHFAILRADAYPGFGELCEAKRNVRLPSLIRHVAMPQISNSAQ